jgi:hypothetical protein
MTLVPFDISAERVNALGARFTPFVNRLGLPRDWLTSLTGRVSSREG